MTSQFLDMLDARQIGWQNGRPLWMTLRPLRYRSVELNATVVIPAEFVSDLASVPRLLVSWFIAGGRAPRPSVVHDYGYQTGTLPLDSGGVMQTGRSLLDSVLYEAMLADPMDGTDMATAMFIYSGVRVGGWYTWNRMSSRAALLNPVWSSTGWPSYG